MLLDYYQQWSMKTPYITRATCLLLLASYLLSLLFRADMSFGNIPFYTLTHFEIYRLLTSPLVGNSLLNIAILLFVFPALSGRMETSISSLGLLFLMGTITLAVNSAFDLICLLLYLSNATPFALFYNCSGFWTIVFALITVDCMHTPDVPRSLFIIQIPGKLYPLVLYGLFSLLGGGNLLSHGISLAFGYLYSLGYLDFLKVE